MHLLAMDDRTLDRLRRALERVLPDIPEIAAAYAFGSRISGGALPLSDLYVALVLRDEGRRDDPLLAERISVRIASELRSAIEGDEAVEIDAHLAEDLPLPVRGRVVTGGMLLYEADPSSRVDFETSTRRKYFDFRPLLERDAREGLLSGG